MVDDELEKGTKDNTLTMILFPKWKKGGWRGRADRILKRDGQMLGTFENEKIAEKLRNPKAYYRKWNKTPRVKLESRLNKIEKERIYLITGCGLLLYFLIILIIIIIKIKKKKELILGSFNNFYLV